jgi:hypothetical protein
VVQGASLTVMAALRAYRAEAHKAREERLRLTKANWDMFMGVMDWSHKQKGQSREHLPKVAMAKEQISAFIERGLTDFGDWFTTDLKQEDVLSDEQARKLLQYALDSASTSGSVPDEDFPALVADLITVALMGSLMILKIHGRDATKDVFRAERGIQYIPAPDGSVVPQIVSNLVRRQVDYWQSVIDLVAPEDYLPDPTGRKLYEMHEVERDLAQVQAMADAGVYDQAMVDQIEEDYAQEEDRAYRTDERSRDRTDATPPDFRRRVVILECWGDILDDRGRYAERNIVCAMANNKYLIRPPEPNPYWHGKHPFASRPLLRVPFSTWHKALFDHAVALNKAEDELYNLILDGGIASVWGVKQLYPEYLDDPRQVKDGIVQGDTLIIKEGAPPGLKVVEQVVTGKVPPEALAAFQLTDQEFQIATQVNATRMGQTPGGETTATAVVEAQAQSANFFDGMIKDTEKTISQALSLMWSNLMQFMDDADAEEVVSAVGEEAALRLAMLSPAERYAQLAGCQFKVTGLSAIVARVRDFQKLMAILQLAGSNPVMGLTFWQRFSPTKIWNHLFKSVNLDPSTLEPDPQEQAQMGQMQQMLMQQQGGTPGAGGGSGGGPQEVPGNLPVERMPVAGGM